MNSLITGAVIVIFGTLTLIWSRRPARIQAVVIGLACCVMLYSAFSDRDSRSFSLIMTMIGLAWLHRRFAPPTTTTRGGL